MDISPPGSPAAFPSFTKSTLQEGAADSDAALKELSAALPDYEVACVNYSTAKKGYSGALIMLHKDCPKPIKASAEDLPSAKDEGRMVLLEFETLYVILCLVMICGCPMLPTAFHFAGFPLLGSKRKSSHHKPLWTLTHVQDIARCYVPNSGDGLKRLTERIEKWDVQLRKRLQTLAAKKHVLLMGDLNVAHQDKDSGLANGCKR